MPIVKYWNINDKIKKHPETKGRIAGHFMDSDPFFKTDHFEIKRSTHKKWEIKYWEIAKNTAKTISILIKWKFLIEFPDIKKEIILSKTWDYTSYDTHKLLHNGKAIEDSTIITIRRPSKR